VIRVSEEADIQLARSPRGSAMLNLAAGRVSRLEEVRKRACRGVLAISASSTIQASRLGSRCTPWRTLKPLSELSSGEGQQPPLRPPRVQRCTAREFWTHPSSTDHPTSCPTTCSSRFPRRPSSPPSVILPRLLLHLQPQQPSYPLPLLHTD
jgi:hypothetical protein